MAVLLGGYPAFVETDAPSGPPSRSFDQTFGVEPDVLALRTDYPQGPQVRMKRKYSSSLALLRR